LFKELDAGVAGAFSALLCLKMGLPHGVAGV